jgi:site-specific recombinase
MEVSYELFKETDKRQEYTEKSKVKFELLKSALYQDLKEGIISEEEFYDMREFYTNRIVESELILEKQNKEISRLYQKSLGNKDFFFEIRAYGNISTLERGLLVRLVDKICVLEEKMIEVRFNYDETIEILDKLSNYAKQSSGKMKEVV